VSLRKFFSKESDLVYCDNDIDDLSKEFNYISYDASDWRLLIDSSTRSLKAVLLHNGNVYTPISIPFTLEEKYCNLNYVLNYVLGKLQYNVHN